ncbi:MAG TPA: hypothetical protein PL143_15685, partial [Rhodocyclaceae bacterium]|nr:hypothetical protein [Rhodocyclaceae bacterium]
NHRNAPAALPVWLGWALAVGASTFAFVLVPRFDTHNAVGTADLVTLAWPVIVGTAMSIAAWRWLRAWPVPAGDLIVWLAAAAHAACRATTRLQAPPWPLVGKAAAAMAALQIAAPRHGRRWSARSSLLEQLWRREAALVFAALLVLMLVLSLGALP